MSGLDDEKPSKKSNRDKKSTKDQMDSSMSKIQNFKKTAKSEESKRNLKWISFTRAKFSFGFQHLSAAYVPAMSEEPHGFAICLEKVSGWSIPPAVLKEFGKGDYEVTAQLSLSMFHLSSSTFFGTTWMGPSVSLGHNDYNDSMVSKVIDFEYEDIIYMISRITDPTCVGIIEIVVSKYDLRKNLVVGQFGCGWTMLNLFKKPPPVDIASGHENVDITSCALFSGSPRDLIVNNDMKTLASRLKEIPNCSLYFKLFSHKRLLRARKFIAENAAIGRYEAIAGLIPRTVIPPGTTNERRLACIGDEELVNQKDGVISLPVTPKLATEFTIEIIECQLSMPNRIITETKMISTYAKMLHLKDSSTVEILSRKLRIGIHNGNTVLGGDWYSHLLLEDQEDKDMFYIDPNDHLILEGYIPDVHMALTFIVEYELGSPVSKETHFNSYAMMRSTSWANGRTKTSFAVGASFYIPFNGQKLLLQNTDIRASEEDGVDIQLELQNDEICRILSAKPIILDGMVNEREGIENLSIKAGSKKDPIKASAEDESEYEKSLIGFDLRVIHPKHGQLLHNTDMEDILNEDRRKSRLQLDDTIPTRGFIDDGDALSPKRRSRDAKLEIDDDDVLDGTGRNRTFNSSYSSKSKGFNVTKRTTTKLGTKTETIQDFNDDDSRSIADSLVTGDTERSSLRLDAFHYTSIGYNKDRDKLDWDVFSEHSSDVGGRLNYYREKPLDREVSFYPPRDRNSLLAKSLQTKLVSQDQSGLNILKDNSELNNFYKKVSNNVESDMKVASKTLVNSNAAHIRDLSRGARSRLSRHGFDGAIIDNSLNAFIDQSQVDMNKINVKTGKNVVVDIELEARDELSLHEVNIQFAGMRVGTKHVKASNTGVQLPQQFQYVPKAVYFSFQFYSCMATRTEIMRLIPAEEGQLCVLARDEAYARDETPLTLRYLIDSSTASPNEAIEFAEYLATCALYVDVWDADSLLHIGTCGIPLRRLMRQGQVTSKQAIECDIINSEVGVISQGQTGITSNVIADGGPMSGSVVGAVQVILSNFGQRGKGRLPSKLIKINEDFEHLDGLNWRAFGVQRDIKQTHGPLANRPKNSVRAKPLSESSPELNKALLDVRRSSDNKSYTGPSLRSLTSERGAPGLCTLTYDEVAIMFRRFRGALKGTVQYAGDLLNLLDMPSLSVALKKLIQAYKTFGDYDGLLKETLRHANAASELKLKDLEDFFHIMFDKTGIKCRTEEIILLTEKVMECGVDQYIGASKVIEFCAEETDRHEWTLVGNRLRLAAQKATLEGVDIEQILSDFDVSGSHYINVSKFKEFIRELGKYGNLGTKDINLCCRHFSRRPHTSEDDHDPISLKEIMAFLGVEYVGNLQARVRHIIDQDKERSPTVKEILHILNNVRGSNSKDQSTQIKYSYEEVETVFSMLGIHKHISHDQIRAIIKKLDAKNQGKITTVQILNYLGISYKASDLSAHNPEPKVINLEEILKLYLDKVQSGGVAVVEAFRRFDVNGDGSITKQELVQGLTKLGMFDNVPDWKKQIPSFIKKLDKDGDGDISLREFFTFLGIKDYAPDIIQRMTRVFSVAVQKKVSIKDIFTHLDKDKSGQLDAAEIENGLKALGTFDEISSKDVDSVIKHFDKDGNRLVSIDEFVGFFTERVNQSLKDRRKKRADKVALILRKTMTSAISHGTTLKNIFGHLDKDNSGSVDSRELAAAIMKLPSFKKMKEQDINDLMDQLDIDASGDITFAEFEAFVMNGDDITLDDSMTSIGTLGTYNDVPVALIDLLRETFRLAETKGLTFDETFQILDKDGSGEFSAEELYKTLQSMPKFKNVNITEVKELMRMIDIDGNGEISLGEFRQFIKDGKRPNRTESVKKSSSTKAQDHIDKDYAKEIFIRHIRRISQIDGSVSALLAYLDDDEDGIIKLSTFKSLLRREDVFTTLPEQQVEQLLQPLMQDQSSVRVTALLRFIEGTHINNFPRSEEKEQEIVVSLKEYTFSSDPEIRSLEKKVRGFGRILSKKGIDVEGLFKIYDPKLSGSVRRTEFLEVLSKLGMYILEQGKIMDQAIKSENDIQQLQMHQVNRLKGKGVGYAYNAPRMARKMLMNGGDVQPSGDFKDHLESMAIVNWYRQSQKQMLLQRVLSHSLAHTIRLYPRFGKTVFFEYAITNPFAHEERFQIEINDPELRLVTAFDEWIHLRKTCRSAVGEFGGDPVEAEMFDKVDGGNIQVALLPHETLFIPFTFMTLIPIIPEVKIFNKNNSKSLEIRNQSSRPISRFDKERLHSDNEDEQKYINNDNNNDIDEEDPLRAVEVKVISGTHGHIISILKVLVCPRPFILNRTIRFQEPENSIMKRRIQIVGHENMSMYPGEYSHGSKYIHCVEGTGSNEEQSRVVVEWGPATEHFTGSGALDLLIRYRCGAFPFTGTFYLLIYNDPYQSQLHEIWQIVVHTRQRLDIHGTVGSAALADLVVRGDRFARRSRAYAMPSAADVINFKPDTVFQLVPGAYNRVALSISPKIVGYRQVQLNLVDVDSRELISAWLLIVSATSPAIMRTYDVEVPVGRPLHKKIIFKNPWDIPRKFILTSSDEGLMRIRAPLVEVTANGNAYLRLWFSGLASGGTGIREVHLFLNDANGGQSEECYLFRIRDI